MKKFYLLALFLSITVLAFAKKHTIKTSGLSFDPASLTVNLGDTIIFEWTSGSHTTTSANIPQGATTWDAPLTGSSTTFTYIPSAIGTYNFVCTPHQGAGMTGSFTVQESVVSSFKEKSKHNFNWSYNPQYQNLTVNFKGQSGDFGFAIYNSVGKTVLRHQQASNMENISLNLPRGLYIIGFIVDDQQVSVQKLMIY